MVELLCHHFPPNFDLLPLPLSTVSILFQTPNPHPRHNSVSNFAFNTQPNLEALAQYLNTPLYVKGSPANLSIAKFGILPTIMTHIQEQLAK